MYNIIADGYDTNSYFEQYRKNRELTAIEKELLDKVVHYTDRNILDVCCGDGSLYDKYLTSKGCSITGIDISSKQIERAKRNNPEASYINGDFLDCSLSIRFDAIICMYGMFHFLGFDAKTALAKMKRYVKMSGYILLKVRKEFKPGVITDDNWCGRPMCWTHHGITNYLIWATEVGFTCQVYEEKENTDYVLLLLSATN